MRTTVAGELETQDPRTQAGRVGSPSMVDWILIQVL